jgi:DNA repair exonuclease SbcCD nuclease subunit
MRVAILSDFHFGFGDGSERANDPYDAFKEAIEKAMGCDLIIFAGDIFDNRSPDAETLTRAMELMIPPLLTQTGVKLMQGIGKDVSKVSEMALMGIPIVAIHGTHERRTKGLLNPVEALEKAGFLIYLHCNGVVFDKDGTRVAIQGMSGVPDQYAESVLSNWNPAPEHGCFNILILHQSITEFLYAPHTLDLNKLPKGFDVYVDGHIHEAKESEYAGGTFLLSGSLVPTQIREESEKPKGFWIIETSLRDEIKDSPVLQKARKYLKNGYAIYWIELGHQRKVYVRSFENPDIETVEAELGKIVKENPQRKPIVRIDFKGRVSPTLADEIEMKFGAKAILSLKREKEEKALPTKTLEEHKLSVEELGRKILMENLAKAGLETKAFESLFELLSAGKSDEAMALLEKASLKEEKPKNVKQTRLFLAGKRQ